MCDSSCSLSISVQGACLYNVNQGGVQKATPQLTLYESHTVEESLRRRGSGLSVSVGHGDAFAAFVMSKSNFCESTSTSKASSIQ